MLVDWLSSYRWCGWSTRRRETMSAASAETEHLWMGAMQESVRMER